MRQALGIKPGKPLTAVRKLGKTPPAKAIKEATRPRTPREKRLAAGREMHKMEKGLKSQVPKTEMDEATKAKARRLYEQWRKLPRAEKEAQLKKLRAKKPAHNPGPHRMVPRN